MGQNCQLLLWLVPAVGLLVQAWLIWNGVVWVGVPATAVLLVHTIVADRYLLLLIFRPWQELAKNQGTSLFLVVESPPGIAGALILSIAIQALALLIWLAVWAYRQCVV